MGWIIREGKKGGKTSLNTSEATLASHGRRNRAISWRASFPPQFNIAAGAGGRLASPSARCLTVLLLMAWPARAFLFWHPRWKSSFSAGKAASALLLLLRRCAGCPTLCRLFRVKYISNATPFAPTIPIFVPNALNPCWWEIFQCRIFVLKCDTANLFLQNLQKYKSTE